MNFSSRIVCKIEKNTLSIVVDGSFKTIQRNCIDADKLIELCRKFNNTSNVEEREKIKEEIIPLANPAKRIELKSNNQFEFDGNQSMYLKGTSDPIPEFLASKLLDFIENKVSVEPLINFWKHLLLNPDPGVRMQLYGFLEHGGHPITDGGYFLAYKAVSIKKKYDTSTGEEVQSWSYDEETGEKIEQKITQELVFCPFHNGTHGMRIIFGEPVAMPREECDPNPDQTCSSGLHVGSMEYVGDFGHSDASAILEVLVSPRNVVAVPTDYNNTKMRCCEYYPVCISEGENDKIYLESDYAPFDEAALDAEINEFAKKKAEQIESLESELEEMKMISGSITV